MTSNTFDEYLKWGVRDGSYGDDYFIKGKMTLRVDSAIDEIDVSLNVNGQRFVADEGLYSGWSRNWWKGEITRVSYDYLYSEAYPWDMEGEIESEFYSYSTEPGSTFDAGGGWFIEGYEREDQWVVDSDYGLSEITDDLIMREFERLDYGLWTGLWLLGDGYQYSYSYYDHLDDDVDGYWVANLESVKVSTVPIPAALPLFAAGVGLLGFSFRKKES